jgi:CheY-like chemotaxis protein
MSFVIMVVDDEDLTRQLLHHMLSRAGYIVVEAGNGQEALQQLAVILPDLIIIDVLMPHLDGFATIRQVRSNPQTAPIPVIFLSSRADVSAEYEGLKAGAQRYLVKPLGLTELVRQVQELLAEGAPDNARLPA